MEGVTFKSGTIGEIPTTTETPIETQTQVVETTDADITTELAAETVVTETKEAVAEQAPIDESVSDFKIEGFDAPVTATVTAATTTTDWRDAIKAVDKKELLKELGVSDFAIGLDEHISNGGSTDDYLYAKGVDWNKVPDVDIIFDELKKEFPDATNVQLQRLFNKKYNQGDLADDEEKEDGKLLLSADARKLRQGKIEQQQRFKSPEPIQKQQAAQVDNSAKERAEQIAKINEFFASHEKTQNLINSKRVAIDLGDAGQFNFNIDRPEILVKAITDNVTWQKITSTSQGEPDVDKLFKIAKYAINPDAHDKALFNYGKSFGLKGIVKEGQNARRPDGQMPATPNITEADAWKTQVKQSTLGAKA